MKKRTRDKLNLGWIELSKEGLDKPFRNLTLLDIKRKKEEMDEKIRIAKEEFKNETGLGLETIYNILEGKIEYQVKYPFK